MLRNEAIPLVVLVICAGIFGIWYAIASVPYFPASLQSTFVDCADGRPYGLSRVAVLDEFEADWFAGELRGLRERPLFPAGAGPERTVRFTWIRSFHPAVMVRTIEEADGQVRLVARSVEGLDGCPPGGANCKVDRRLTAAERSRLVAAQRMGLTAPAHACRGGLDGARWIIEASGRGDYQFAQSFSPESGPLRDLALTMLDLTGWRFNEVY